ncbi:MAG: hypothetical protein VX990_01860 [Pseudomonadota bacterium]|nr:hypothetical protein [Pseudomonadota bacterium]
MDARVVIVHTLDQAQAAAAVAVELGVPLTLRSAPGAGAYLGAEVFQSIVDSACARCPEATVHAVLDCGDDPGLALLALRVGVKGIALKANKKVRVKIADIAAQYNAALEDDVGAHLDLLDCEDPKAAVRDWFIGDT